MIHLNIDTSHTREAVVSCFKSQFLSVCMYLPVTLANVVLFAFHREMCGPSAMKLCTKLADISRSNIARLNMLFIFFTVSRCLIYLLSVSVTTESLGDWSIGHIAILFKR